MFIQATAWLLRRTSAAHGVSAETYALHVDSIGAIQPVLEDQHVAGKGAAAVRREVRTNRASDHFASALEQSEASSVSVRTGRTIFGHTALDNLTIYTVALGTPEACKRTVKKVLAALEKNISLQKEEELGVSTEVTAAYESLQKGEVGKGAMRKVQDALSQLPFTTWYQTGNMWTARDERSLVTCDTKTVEKLEEATETADGDHVIQGDMIVPRGPHGEASFLQIQEAIKEGRRWAGKIWTVSETKPIQYCFHTSLSSQNQVVFKEAVDHIQGQVGCVKFKEVDVDATDGDKCSKTPSVIIKGGTSCGSNVGYLESLGLANKSQLVVLGTGCETMGIVAHELGHTLGMVHEMCRTDRDKYVTIHPENVKHFSGETGSQTDTFKYNFVIDNKTLTNSTFDMLSLMMYDAFSFSKDNAGNKMTVEPHDSRFVRYMGQRSGFSQLDVEQIGNMYNCPNKVTPTTENKVLAQKMIAGEFENFDKPCYDELPKDWKNEKGKKVGGYPKPKAQWKDPAKTAYYECMDLKAYCMPTFVPTSDSQKLVSEVVKLNCPVSCFLCIPDSDITTTTMSKLEKAKQVAKENWGKIMIACIAIVLVVVILCVVVVWRVRSMMAGPRQPLTATNQQSNQLDDNE